MNLNGTRFRFTIGGVRGRLQLQEFPVGGKLTLEHRQSRVARLLFVITAFGAIALTAAHIFVGGRFFVGGIFASNDLDPVVQWMGYFVWHVVSVTPVPYVWGALGLLALLGSTKMNS